MFLQWSPQSSHSRLLQTPTNVYPSFWNSNFHITVILPDVGNSAPLHIKDLETDLPDSGHQIGDLNNNVIFETISLSGSNGPITVQVRVNSTCSILSALNECISTLQSLATTTGKINTSNGQISGVFNASQSLLLSTTNSGIHVDVGLTSQAGNSNPTLTARTSNG